MSLDSYVSVNMSPLLVVKRFRDIQPFMGQLQSSYMNLTYQAFLLYLNFLILIKRDLKHPRSKLMKLDYPIRLNSYLAKSGHGSRRHCETLIEEGRVKVNNQIVEQLSLVVEKNDVVHVDDVLAKPLERGLYYALNKPVGYVSSNTDPFEKLYARDLLTVENVNYL